MIRKNGQKLIFWETGSFKTLTKSFIHCYLKNIDINNAFYAQQLKLYFSSFYEKRKLILVSVYYLEINYEPIY